MLLVLLVCLRGPPSVRDQAPALCTRGCRSVLSLLFSLLLLLLYWSSPCRDHCSATMKSSSVLVAPFVSRTRCRLNLYSRLSIH